jgi:hypothetical protein
MAPLESTGGERVLSLLLDRYFELEAQYDQKIESAKLLANDLPKPKRNDFLHDNYRRIFASIYHPLRAVLEDMAAVG